MQPYQASSSFQSWTQQLRHKLHNKNLTIHKLVTIQVQTHVQPQPTNPTMLSSQKHGRMWKLLDHHHRGFVVRPAHRLHPRLSIHLQVCLFSRFPVELQSDCLGLEPSNRLSSYRPIIRYSNNAVMEQDFGFLQNLRKREETASITRFSALLSFVKVG